MKRIISLLLCFVTFLSIMSSFSTNVFAYTSPSQFDVAGAENKAYELLSVLGGDGAYFTCNR
ncbi:MAG: hypothetical protein II702_06480, partial [Clostridia bacterium]|nr:hypothetical protein [Clostridia bacterium]